MTRWLSFALLLVVIVGVAAVFVRVMAAFLLPLFLATLLVVMFRPLHQWMLKKMKGRERLAALLTTAAIALIVLFPMGIVVTLAGREATSLLARLNDKDIRERGKQLRSKLGLEYHYKDEIRYLESSLDSMRMQAAEGAAAKGDCTAGVLIDEAITNLEQQLKTDGRSTESIKLLQGAAIELKEMCNSPQRIGTLAYQSKLRETAAELRKFKIQLAGGEIRAWLQEVCNPTSQELNGYIENVFVGAPGFLRSLGGATTSFIGQGLLGLVVLLLGVYFFLVDGPKMITSLMRLSPLDDRHESELLDEFDRIARAVVVATLLSAVVQGMLAGIGFWMAGVGSVFLLIMLTILFALIPFVGAATVWVPVSLSLYFYEGRPVAAIILALYGAIIVSMADNVIKPLVLHGQSNLHPLLALLSVLGGVQVLGPIGILVGPMVVVFLQTLLNILNREMTSMDQRVQSPAV
jgi:predicted PurR-regulated permease PerM